MKNKFVKLLFSSLFLILLFLSLGVPNKALAVSSGTACSYSSPAQYGCAYQTSGSTGGTGSTFCGYSFCSDKADGFSTDVDYQSYGITAGDCTYHSWASTTSTCGPAYANHYWSSSCDKTYKQRVDGTTVSPRCIPWTPKNVKCVSDSTGYTITWNAIPYATFRVYNGTTLLASLGTTSYRSTNLGIKSYTIKSYAAGRENATGATITCPAPPPVCTAPNSNPHFECQNNSCVSVSSCATNSEGCTSAGGSCGAILSCSSLTANPSVVTVGNTSALTANCTNATSNTTYVWSSNCGSVTSGTTTGNNTNTWTAPNNSAVCTVSVNACNGSTCSPASTNITVNSNLCNAGPLINCDTCQPALASCGAGNGSQTCQYSTFNGSTNCISLGTVANVCDLAVCASATPTPTPSTCTNGATQCSSTVVPQTCINGAWVNGAACISGQTCTNGICTSTAGRTLLAFRIGMDAIGSAGDNVNPNPSSSNQTPVNTTRNLAVQIFDSNNSQVFAQVGSINYNSGSGVFTGTVDLGANFASGNYTVKVKSDGHLRRLIPGIQNISSALTQPIQMLRVNLVAGDIDSNNALNIKDYNILLSCVTSPFVANIDNHALCNTNSNYLKQSDLEDNGVVNEFDYNLFLREYAVQSGD